MSKKINFLIKILSIVGIGFFLVGCSSKGLTKANIVIPDPPEDPRLFYLDSYSSGSSLGGGSVLNTFIGKDTGRSSGRLFKPYGVSAFKDKMYVADTAVGYVLAFDFKNKKVSTIGAEGKGKLVLPAGVATDNQGNIYVSDAKLKKVFGYTPQGELMYAIGKKGELRRPTGIAVNPKLGRIYVVDTKAHNVKVYSLSNNAKLFQFGNRGSGAGRFNFPTNITVDKTSGNIIVSDTQNFRIQIFNKDGEFIKKIGKIGDRPGMFARPKGVAIDTEGHIYVADSVFNNIQIFNQKGQLMLWFGGHWRGEAGTFIQVSGLHIDDQDKLYVVDGLRGVVQVYQYVSEKWKVANPAKYKELKTYKAQRKQKKVKHAPSNIKEQFYKKEKLKENQLKF